MPPKKPNAVYDDQGRQRFHGAFTGGFSAGYFNTVGSVEGFQPKTFQSSRSKPNSYEDWQSIDNFLDDEDGTVGGNVKRRDGFGAASKTLTTDSPHAAPLELNFFSARNSDVNSVGLRLLRVMGWREGKKIGSNKRVSDWNSVLPIPSPKHDVYGAGHNAFKNAPEFERARKQEVAREGEETKDTSGFSLFDDEDDVYEGKLGCEGKLGSEGAGGVQRGDFLNEVMDDEEGDDDHNASVQQQQTDLFGSALDSYIGSAAAITTTLDGRAVPANFVLESRDGGDKGKRFPGPKVPSSYREEKFVFARNELVERHRTGTGGLTSSSRSALLGEVPLKAKASAPPMTGQNFVQIQAIMKNRFTSSSTASASASASVSAPTIGEEAKFSTKRQVKSWQPTSLLCKRFNVRQPENKNKDNNGSGGGSGFDAFFHDSVAVVIDNKRGEGIGGFKTHASYNDDEINEAEAEEDARKAKEEEEARSKLSAEFFRGIFNEEEEEEEEEEAGEEKEEKEEEKEEVEAEKEEEESFRPKFVSKKRKLAVPTPIPTEKEDGLADYEDYDSDKKSASSTSSSSNKKKKHKHKQKKKHKHKKRKHRKKEKMI